MIDSDCPRCGSRNTKALTVIHGDGTRDTGSRRTGWFYYRRSFGVHSSSTRGRSESLTAQLAAPPVPPTTAFLTGGGVPLVLLGGVALGGAVGFWVGLAILVLIALAGSDERSQQQLRQWSSTFRCGRCGTVFVAIADDDVTGNRVLPDATDAERQIRLVNSAAHRSHSADRSSSAQTSRIRKSDSASR
jgi:hypothetical protein